MINQLQKDKALLLLEFAYNNHKHNSTGQTPFFFNYGMHSRISLVLNINQPIMEIQHKGDTTFRTCVSMANALLKAKDQLEKAQKKQNKNADTQRRGLLFKADDYAPLSAALL